MPVRFAQITDVETLSEWFDRSKREVVILFNHDPWCPISGRAFREMEAVDDEIALIDVSRERSVTREIASRTGVRHESPQVILLQEGKATWSASHFEITADAVEKAVEQREVRGRARAS